ncbi:hypothetical protein VN97_g11580, partial [Penicillium thymicola]
MLSHVKIVLCLL